MRFVPFITLGLLLLALPAFGKDLDLQPLGVSAASGSGRINGKDMNVIVVTGTDLAGLKAKASAQYVVRELSEHGQKTLLIVDRRAKLRNVADSAYVFSELLLPNGGGALLVGTPIAPLASALQQGPTQYEGSVLPRLPNGANLQIESGFTFGGARVDTSTIAMNVAPGMARTLFVEGLAKAGFLPEAAPSESPQAEGPLAFRKGQTLVHVIVNAGDSGSQSKVILHEVSVP